MKLYEKLNKTAQRILNYKGQTSQNIDAGFIRKLLTINHTFFAGTAKDCIGMLDSKLIHF